QPRHAASALSLGIAEEPFCRLMICNMLKGLWRCPTDDLSQSLSLDRAVWELEIPVNPDPVFWPYIIRFDIQHRGVTYLAIPQLKDSPNCHHATAIDIHKTNIVAMKFCEFLPVFFP